jgi:hypothetical protein
VAALTTYCKVGSSYSDLSDAGVFFGSASDVRTPRSTYQPGQPVVALSGKKYYVGYPIAVWALPVITLDTWRRIKSRLSQLAYSGECWIQTHDDDQNWFIARCVLRLPEPTDLERAAAKYINVKLEFVIVERWDLITPNWYISGTLAANHTILFELPYAWKFYGVKVCSSNDSDATLAASGATAGTLFSATTIGDSGDPKYIQPTSYPVDIAANELVTLTLDYDGAGGTAAQNVMLVLVASASLT